MKIISNTSPLIFLAKIGKLDLLKEHEIIIPKQVYEEIIKGSKVGKEDAHKIINLVEKNIIRIEETKIIKELEKQNIGKGEKAAISLAINNKINLILLDEKKARRIAKFYKLKARGTLGILIEAYKNKKINKKEFKESIRKLIKEGYRIREELLFELLKEIA